MPADPIEAARVNLPTPAIVAERGVERLPRLALLLLCAAYLLPGIFGRAPWRNAEQTVVAGLCTAADPEGRGTVAVSAAAQPARSLPAANNTNNNATEL